MIQAIDINKRIEFSSKDDSGEVKTIFVLRPMSGAEMIDLSSIISGNNIKLSGKQVVDFIDTSLVEIKNFSQDIPKRQVLEIMPPPVLSELVDMISQINNLTEQDKKK